MNPLKLYKALNNKKEEILRDMQARADIIAARPEGAVGLEEEDLRRITYGKSFITGFGLAMLCIAVITVFMTFKVKTPGMAAISGIYAEVAFGYILFFLSPKYWAIKEVLG